MTHLSIHFFKLTCSHASNLWVFIGSVTSRSKNIILLHKNEGIWSSASSSNYFYIAKEEDKWCSRIDDLLALLTRGPRLKQQDNLYRPTLILLAEQTTSHLLHSAPLPADSGASAQPGGTASFLTGRTSLGWLLYTNLACGHGYKTSQIIQNLSACWLAWFRFLAHIWLFPVSH